MNHIVDTELQEKIKERVEVDPDTGCWIWTKGTTTAGYGVLRRDGRAQYAHRLAYEAFKGPIPDGMSVMHSCDRPSCCNPTHLRVGTHAENMADMANKGRQKRGAYHPVAKLTEADVREIRRLAELGVTQADIGETFGVTQSNVSYIVNRHAWAWLS